MRVPARATAGAAMVAIVSGILLSYPTSFVNLESRFFDVLTRWSGPGTPSGQVAIVAIDEPSLTSFGRWPWPRDLIARLLRGILESGSRTVVLDIMFPQTDRGNDEVLAGALRGQPVVDGYTMRFGSAVASASSCSQPPLPLVVAGPTGWQRAAFFHSTGVLCNVPPLSEASSGSGFLNAAPDSDGVMRRVPLLMEMNSRYYPSLALAALTQDRHASLMELITDSEGAQMLRLGTSAVPLEGPSLLRLRFRGAGQRFPHVSAQDVLSGQADKDLLRGKIVVVGGAASGMESSVVTPVDPLFPAVELQATAIDNLVAGDFFHRPGNAHFWELVCAVLAGAASTWLLIRFSLWWGTFAVFGIGVADWVACALVLKSTGALYSPLPVNVMLVCTLPVVSLISYLQEKNRADRTQKQLNAVTQASLEALRESESRYHRLVDNINDAITVHDPGGWLLFANRRFIEWFDLKDGEIGRVAFERYVAPEWRAKVRDRHKRMMQGEIVPDQFEFEGIRPDGTRIWIEALVTRIDDDGRITGVQAALRDTTERKRIEAQYLQSRKMETVGRLAGGVAHDFNNLLTIILTYSDLLLEKIRPGDPARRGLEDIRKAAERAADLTRKLLAFSRKQLIQPQPVDLNLIVSESHGMLERVIGEDIELITRLAPGLGQVTADPGQLHQVLMNLIVNARDAMPDGGMLIVETRNQPAGDEVYLGVTDSGTGMTEEVKQHLFEPFFTTKGPGEGTGLGLATVYGIVQQIGGRIEVASELGNGTTFHIYLPRIEAPSPRQPADRTRIGELSGSETVLVVEDQEAVRNVVATILRKYGYCVLEASNGPDAIKVAETSADVIHLLLTDIIMPVMDGRALAEKLTAMRPEMRVLYVSGYSEKQLERGRPFDRHSAYLLKPFTPEVLASKVRDVLGANSERSRASTDGA